MRSGYVVYGLQTPSSVAELRVKYYENTLKRKRERQKGREKVREREREKERQDSRSEKGDEWVEAPRHYAVCIPRRV